MSVEKIQSYLDEVRDYIGEIPGFDISNLDKLVELPEDKHPAALAFLKKVYEEEWQEMNAVHQLPCYDQESMENMLAMFDVPIHAEHKRIAKAHSRFKRRWRRFQERLNGTKKDTKTSKSGDENSESVDRVSGS